MYLNVLDNQVIPYLEISLYYLSDVLLAAKFNLESNSSRISSLSLSSFVVSNCDLPKGKVVEPNEVKQIPTRQYKCPTRQNKRPTRQMKSPSRKIKCSTGHLKCQRGKQLLVY